MAKSYTMMVPSHNSIYTHNFNKNNYNKRTIRVDYTEPDKINVETGVLLLIPGYGANIDSKVYKKMRNLFSDTYNLVVLQCSYFGSEFMQAPSAEELINMQNDSTLPKKYITFENGNILTEIYYRMNESIYNMNDMGIMQAIDNLTAVLTVIKKIYDKGHKINTKKVIIYGHSHGAYLAYLCNRFCPNMFNLIIENSAYIFPTYLDVDRTLYYDNIILNYSYKIKNMRNEINRELYSLISLYRNFENSCYIISFHGKLDYMTKMQDKMNFAHKIKK